ncbi:MAG: hypothetical protein ACYS76_04230 [Planctomycetota bacterium]|jgi:hypothetical protein
MPDRRNLITRLVFLQFLLLFLVGSAWGANDKLTEAAANKVAYGSSSYEHSADFYLAGGNYIVVDDMESYNDSNNFIWDTWWDGCWHEVNRPDNHTGAWIELAIDPCDPVHTGTQAMEYYYDNGLSPDRCGYYSQVWRYYDPPVDWAGHGEKALVLWFRGVADNESTPMWVIVSPYSGDSEMATYGDNGEDPGDITVEEWMEWNIRLGDFADAGVDLANVSSMGIGFGDYVDNVPDYTTGVVYFDDIRLYPARCLAQYAPAADLSGDCMVYFEDVMIMAAWWLNVGDVDADIYRDKVMVTANAADESNAACCPSPPDGGLAKCGSGVCLGWEGTSGERDLHCVYLSSDANCVENMDSECLLTYVPARELPQWCVPAEELQLWHTYHWRIVELYYPGQAVPGPVWSFRCGCPLPGDFNRDCIVNFEDYALVAEMWRHEQFWPPE